MLKTIKFLFFFCAAIFSAQNARFYKGKIGNLNLSLYLDGLETGINADQISGSYKYDKQNGYFLLSGYRNHSGNTVLVEFPDANFSGIFRGKISDKNFNGVWTNDAGTKSIPFSFSQVKPSDVETQKFNKAIRDKQSEFSNY